MNRCAWNLLLLIVFFFPERGWAGTAAFSVDGGTIYSIGETGLIAIDAESGASSELAYPEEWEEGTVSSLSLSAKGTLFVATETGIWEWDPETSWKRKRAEAYASTEFREIACDPVSGGFLVSAVEEDAETGERDWIAYWGHPANEFALASVFIRRLRYLEAPVFDSHGSLYFSTEGDLWWGRIEDQEARPLDGGRPYLHAIRYAPLATRETSEGTPDQTGVVEIAVAGEALWAQARRMGGSGWGSLLRLLPPPETRFGEGADGLWEYSGVEQRIPLYRRAMESVEIITDEWRPCDLCASADGKRVYYFSNNGHWLVEDGGAGEPRLLRKVEQE